MSCFNPYGYSYNALRMRLKRKGKTNETNCAWFGLVNMGSQYFIGKWTELNLITHYYVFIMTLFPVWRKANNSEEDMEFTGIVQTLPHATCHLVFDTVVITSFIVFDHIPYRLLGLPARLSLYGFAYCLYNRLSRHTT